MRSVLTIGRSKGTEVLRARPFVKRSFVMIRVNAAKAITTLSDNEDERVKQALVTLHALIAPFFQQ